jgi:hypothetical protein
MASKCEKFVCPFEWGLECCSPDKKDTEVCNTKECELYGDCSICEDTCKEESALESKWYVTSIIHDSYITHDFLKDKEVDILITYETPRGRRYVKKVRCSHGYIPKKFGGKLVAWRLCPKAYEG